MTSPFVGRLPGAMIGPAWSPKIGYVLAGAAFFA